MTEIPDPVAARIGYLRARIDGTPGATEDLNRLYSEFEARWDVKRRRWVLREDGGHG